MNGVNVWNTTPGLTEAFMALCVRGNLSFNEIAAKLNSQFQIELSRSGYIGKADRLKKKGLLTLPGRAKPTHSRRKPQFTFPQLDGRGAGSIGQRIARRNKRSPIPLDPTFVFDRPEDIPLDQRRTFAQLENCHCRYPYNDPGEAEFFYCGAPEADIAHGIPYCRTHMDHAYDGIPEPKDADNRRYHYRPSRLMPRISRTIEAAE